MEESDYIQKLRNYIRTLETQNQVLGQENTMLTEKLRQQNAQDGNSVDPELAGPAEDAALSDEACRKRLERLCKRNKQGLLGQKKSKAINPAF